MGFSFRFIIYSVAHTTQIFVILQFKILMKGRNHAGT